MEYRRETHIEVEQETIKLLIAEWLNENYDAGIDLSDEDEIAPKIKLVKQGREVRAEFHEVIDY